MFLIEVMDNYVSLKVGSAGIFCIVCKHNVQNWAPCHWLSASGITCPLPPTVVNTLTSFMYQESSSISCLSFIQLRNLAFKKIPQKSCAPPPCMTLSGIAGELLSPASGDHNPPSEGWQQWKQRDEQVGRNNHKLHLSFTLSYVLSVTGSFTVQAKPFRAVPSFPSETDIQQ